MKILDAYKTIFVHVPKTGGLTLRNLFETTYLAKGNSIPRAEGLHSTLKMLIESNTIVDIWKYSILTVKRNTYERIASHYMEEYYKKIMNEDNNEIPPLSHFISLNRTSFFYYITDENDEIWPRINFLNFKTFERDLIVYWKYKFNINLKGLVPHKNNKKSNEIINEFRGNLLSDSEFIRLVEKYHNKEIEYFEYERPT